MKYHSANAMSLTVSLSQEVEPGEGFRKADEKVLAGRQYVSFFVSILHYDSLEM